jgi:hypothetical protein
VPAGASGNQSVPILAENSKTDPRVRRNFLILRYLVPKKGLEPSDLSSAFRFNEIPLYIEYTILS